MGEVSSPFAVGAAHSGMQPTSRLIDVVVTTTRSQNLVVDYAHIPYVSQKMISSSCSGYSFSQNCTNSGTMQMSA